MKMRHHVALIVLVCTTLLSSDPALAQFSQQGPKLVGRDAVGIAEQGGSVSLSSDGNTAIVGGIFDSSTQGAAWVWTRSGLLHLAAAPFFAISDRSFAVKDCPWFSTLLRPELRRAELRFHAGTGVCGLRELETAFKVPVSIHLDPLRLAD
jgi:hypothetical protein